MQKFTLSTAICIMALCACSSAANAGSTTCKADATETGAAKKAGVKCGGECNGNGNTVNVNLTDNKGCTKIYTCDNQGLATFSKYSPDKCGPK